jgi:hypothetical protein
MATTRGSMSNATQPGFGNSGKAKKGGNKIKPSAKGGKKAPAVKGRKSGRGK